MKKFIISSQALKLVLNKLAPAVNEKATLPVLTNVLCRATKGQVEFIATDLELTIIHPCTAEVQGEPFEMLMPFKLTKKLVGLCGDVPLSIELKGKKASITGENEVYDLNSLGEVTDYPKLPDLPTKNVIKVDKTFIDWLSKTLPACSTDELRPAMTAVCLDVTTTGITMVGTDAHVASTRKFDIESKVADQLLVSPKIITALKGFTDAQIYWRKSHIAFKNDATTIIALRMDAKFPDYKVVFPKTEKNLDVDKDELVTALEKCGLSTVSTGQTDFLLDKAKTSLVLDALDVDMDREFHFTVAGIYSGDVEKVAVNSHKLLTLLHQVESGTVHFAIDSPTKAIIMTCENDSAYVGLIMPLLINS
jgi:DNA polymerase-3 subunit beta